MMQNLARSVSSIAVRRQSNSIGQTVRHMTVKITPIHASKATATGGRNGTVKSDDGALSVNLTLPKALGGPGAPGKSDPEQLFAAGYAACFQGAMGVASRNLKKTLPAETTVTTTVHIGKDSTGALGLAVEIEAHAPGLSKSDLQSIMDAAHKVCPYSRATQGNIDVKLTAA